MEKTIRICDECKKRVATLKCDICNGDMCDDTSCKSKIVFSGDVWLRGMQDTVTLFNMMICQKCSNRLGDYSERGQAKKRAEMYDSILGFKEKFITTIRKIEVLDGLDDEKQKS